MIKRTSCLKPVTGMSLAFFTVFLPFSAVSICAGTIDESSLATASGQTTSASQLLQLSGLSGQLQSLPAAVIDSFEQSIRSDGLALPFSESDIPALKSALGSVFNSERLQQSVQQQLNRELSEEQFVRLTRFYRSARGREISQAEAGNSVLRNRVRFTQWHEQSGMRSLDASRQLAIRDLERALKATDAAVDTVISMQVALQVGVTPALPEGHKQSVTQLISTARAQRSSLTRTYRDSSLESLAFVFQNQSLESLQAFAAMLKTPAGQNYVHAVNLGLSRGMLEAAEALGEAMQPLLSRHLGRGV